MNFLELLLYTEDHRENDEKDARQATSESFKQKFNNVLDFSQPNHSSVKSQYLSVNGFVGNGTRSNS